jgi:hypothetical protein
VLVVHAVRAVRATQGRSLLTDVQRQRMQEIAGETKRAAVELTRRWQLLTPRDQRR